MTKIAVLKQKNDFWPQLFKFSGQNCTFSPDMREPKVLLSPPRKLNFRSKNGQIWPKTGIFLPNISLFCPFDPMPDQKTMRKRCLGGSFVIWLPKLLLTYVKIRTFGPKKAKFGAKKGFLVILGKILFFFGWLAGFISQDIFLLFHIAGGWKDCFSSAGKK